MNNPNISLTASKVVFCLGSASYLADYEFEVFEANGKS